MRLDWLTNLYGKAKKVFSARAEYEAAKKGRRSKWVRGSGSSANAEVKGALTMLRNRSREMVRNNPYASKAVSVITANLIGTGIRAAAQHKSQRVKQKVDEIFTRFAESTDIDLDGVNNLYGLQALACRCMVESGEAIIIKHRTTTGEVPLKIQVLEGDHLDHTKDGVYEGERIVQGVHFNPNGSIKGYWLHPQHPGELGYIHSHSSAFVSAERVIHLREVTRAGQVRGVPWGVAGFTRLSNIDDYQDARVELMKVASCLAGFIIQDGSSDAESDILPEKLEPGMLPRLEFGQDVRFNTPPSVSGHEDFIASELYSVAAAYGISFEALTGNLKRVNFASGRMGWLEFQRNLTRWQSQIVIPIMCKRIESWFMDAAILAGHRFKGAELKWTAPRREMIDPVKETSALVLAIRSGLKPWQEAVRELGYDPQTFAKMMGDDNDLFDLHGLTLQCDPRRTTQSGQVQSVDEDDKQDDKQDNEHDE